MPIPASRRGSGAPASERSNRQLNNGHLGVALFLRMTKDPVVQDGLVRRLKLEIQPPDEEQYRLLVDAVIDYAIYMLDPQGQRVELEQRRAPAERLRGVGDHRPAFLALLHRGGPRRRPAATRPGGGRARRPLRERGLARAQGRYALLGERGDRRHPRRQRHAAGVRQGHARHYRAAQCAAGARGGARGTVPLAEDGSARPLDRRHRARFQQSADGDPGQPRAACANGCQMRQPTRRRACSTMRRRPANAAPG